MQSKFLMQKIHDKIVKSTIAIIGRLRPLVRNRPKPRDDGEITVRRTLDDPLLSRCSYWPLYNSIYLVTNLRGYRY